MLNYLSIKNFALIEDTFLEFSEGLNVITGETGAGKTIAIEALGLILGDKSKGAQVRKGTSRLTVSSGFQVGAPRLQKILKDLDLSLAAGEEEIVIRREVEINGRSRSFINDRPVNSGTLSKLGELLVYSHGQHEHQLLLKPTEQRDVLDFFGGLEKERESVSVLFKSWKNLKGEQEALSLSEQERAQRIDLYRFQKQELDEANPKVTEEEELERLLPQLKNADKIKTHALATQSLLKGDDRGILEVLAQIKKNIEVLQSLGADCGNAEKTVEESFVALEETSEELERFFENVQVDPAQLDTTLSRLETLSRLKKKYGPTLTSVIEYRERVSSELDRLENLDKKNQDIEERLEKARQSYFEKAKKISKLRLAAARKLTTLVVKEFREVGLPHASFDVSVETLPLGKETFLGNDQVSFMFAPNPGEGKQLLAKVASGGELSRVMLAIKSVLAKTDSVPILVFDEIDAGVGGTLGMTLGKKLAKLGQTHQVLCISHLATIAACSVTHFYVEKKIENDRTKTTIRSLKQEDRVHEIARMFGGTGKLRDDAIGLQHARELLEQNGKTN